MAIDFVFKLRIAVSLWQDRREGRYRDAVVHVPGSGLGAWAETGTATKGVAGTPGGAAGLRREGRGLTGMVCWLAVSIDGSVLERRMTCQTSVVYRTGLRAQGTTLSPPERKGPVLALPRLAPLTVPAGRRFGAGRWSGPLRLLAHRAAYHRPGQRRQPTFQGIRCDPNAPKRKGAQTSRGVTGGLQRGDQDAGETPALREASAHRCVCRPRQPSRSAGVPPALLERRALIESRKGLCQNQVRPIKGRGRRPKFRGIRCDLQPSQKLISAPWVAGSALPASTCYPHLVSPQCV